MRKNLALSLALLTGCAPVTLTETQYAAAAASGRACMPLPLTGDHAADVAAYTVLFEESGRKVKIRTTGRGGTTLPHSLLQPQDWEERSGKRQATFMVHEFIHACEQDQSDGAAGWVLIYGANADFRTLAEVASNTGEAIGLVEQGDSCEAVERHVISDLDRMTSFHSITWGEGQRDMALAAILAEAGC